MNDMHQAEYAQVFKATPQLPRYTGVDVMKANASARFHLHLVYLAWWCVRGQVLACQQIRLHVYTGLVCHG